MIHRKTAKRILVTGASRGIGRATSKALAAAGHSVVLAARHEAPLEQVASELRAHGARADVVVLDVTDPSSVDRGVAQALAGGPIDVLVNNAGNCVQRPFACQTLAEQREEFELNYFGAVNMIRAVLPSFIQRGTGGIVNVSSLLGSVASPTTANYCASKAALELLSFGLRAELGPLGIDVSVFVAPHTQTEQGQRVEFRGVRSLPADYVAEALVRCIEAAPRRHAASPVYRVLLRLGAWFPNFMERQMVGATQHLLARSNSRLLPTTRIDDLSSS